MATWVTHLMIADGVLARFPGLHRRGFCVGNIAPDCNVENADWTEFTPSREVTHWMQGARKKASDCDAFCDEYILKRKDSISSAEEYAFLLGYYAHLLTDAAFQAMIREGERVATVWKRIKTDGTFCFDGMEETWDNAKKLIPKKERLRGIEVIEAEYLRDHPDSGYLTEIMPLKEFPDYIDYLPHGAIVRKIGVMGYLPEENDPEAKFIAISREEYAAFVRDTICLVADILEEKQLIRNVYLKPMTREMYHVFFREYQNDPALYLDPADYVSYIYTEEAVERYIQRQIDRGRLSFAIMVGDKIAGELKFYDIKSGESCFMGIAMKNDTCKGKGYGTQAERIAIDYCFHTLDIPVLYADSVLTNTRSQHVLEKAGFAFLREDAERRYYVCRRET